MDNISSFMMGSRRVNLFTERLLARRKQLNLSQPEVVEKVNSIAGAYEPVARMTQATLSRAETEGPGGIKSLSAPLVANICEVLKCDILWLLGRRPEMEPEETIQTDPQARKIFNLYKNFGAQEIEMLVAFTEFLDARRQK